MTGKFSRAFRIVKSCWKVLLLDKEILVFPLLSLITLGALLGVTVGPLWVSGELFTFLEAMSDSGETEVEIWTIAVCFLAYFVTYFVIIFFNSALIACVSIRFAGGDPTVMDGLKAATQRLPLIFAWALFTSTVGFILKMLESKSKGLMKILISFLGAGWAIASYFAVPVLVAEKAGPITAVKRSVSIIKRPQYKAYFPV